MKTIEISASHDASMLVDGGMVEVKLHVNPRKTSRDMLEDAKHLVSQTRDAGRDLCTPATVSGRIVVMTMMNKIPWDAPRAPAVRKVSCSSDARADSDDSAAFRPGFWSFIGLGSEATWEFDKDTNAASKTERSMVSN